MNEQHVSLDISKSQGVAKLVRIGQGDRSGTTIVATVYDNGTAFDMTGMAAKFLMRTPGNGYVEDAHVNVSGNTLTYVVDEEHCAATAGVTDECYFQILQGETVIASTARFSMHVLRAAMQGADPSRAWTNGIEEWLDEASDTLDDAVADANSRVGATINAANAAVEGMRSDVDEAISDTEEVIGRAEDAIDAMGDISEQAVPLMSADVRGGAKLGRGLEVVDGALRVIGLYVDEDGDWCQE